MNKCIVCGEPGLPAVCQRVPLQPKGKVRKVRLKKRNGESMWVESGDLAHGNMVGPGHGPDEFPGDPTGKKYYGSGASAYVLYHPECFGGESLDEYNRTLRKYTPQMADDEEWVYAEDKPSSEGPWRSIQE